MILFHHLIALAITIFFGLQVVGPAMADDAKTIITAGPAWENFTNEDGRGLYHDIIKQVFAGYKVKHLYVPTLQANSMVAIGRADIKMCETKEIDSLHLARLPMYENDFYAVFLRARVTPWKNSISLAGKKVVWRQGYYSLLDFSIPIDFIEVRSGESALKMVMLNRADFYIDDLILIKQSFDNAKVNFDREIFGLERVGTRKYFPVFANSIRGENLRIHFEKEIERLFWEGTLKKIYDRWGFAMPNFKFDESEKLSADRKGIFDETRQP